MATEIGHAPNREYVARDGSYHLNGAPFFNDAEVDVSPQLETVVGGVTAGIKIARGDGSDVLDGSNPTSVPSGLATILSVTVQLKGSAAPGVGTSNLKALINGTNIEVYAFKVTSSIDNTLIASTGGEGFYWVAVGT